MLEILKFIFSSFWIWVGTLTMIAVIVSPFLAIFQNYKGK